MFKVIKCPFVPSVVHASESWPSSSFFDTILNPSQHSCCGPILDGATAPTTLSHVSTNKVYTRVIKLEFYDIGSLFRSVAVVNDVFICPAFTRKQHICECFSPGLYVKYIFGPVVCLSFLLFFCWCSVRFFCWPFILRIIPVELWSIN